MYKLSTQGVSTIMMCLQVGILEEKDMTEIFQGLSWSVNDEEELVCLNPPIVNFASLKTDEEE
jgi:hypothetical protein